MLYKYNSSGQLQWSLSAGQSLVGAQLKRVLLLPSGDVVGIGLLPGGGYLFTQVSAGGTLRGTASLTLTDVRSLCDVKVDGRGSLVLLGAATTGQYRLGFKLTRASATGQLLSHSSFLEPNSTTAGQPIGLALDTAGNAYVTGTLHDQRPPYISYVTAKYNTLGGQEWSQLMPAASTDSVRHIAVDAQGNVCVTGSRGRAALLLRYTPSGTLVWNATYLPPGKTTADGREIAFDPAGSAYLLLYQAPGSASPLGFADLAVVKLGAAVTGTRPPDRQSALGLWPNPAREWVQVQVPTGGQHLEVRNTLGQLVLRQNLSAGSGPVQLPVAALPAGVYMVCVGTASGLYQQRLVKE